jgi:hypothetical protein
MISGNDIHAAGRMPGDDRRGPPFQPLQDKPPKGNLGLPGRTSGLMAREAFERHQGEWLTGRFERHGNHIGSRTTRRGSFKESAAPDR